MVVTGSVSSESETGFFAEKIAPVLERRCYECHSHQSGKAKGGLVLDSRAGWEKGGGQGPAIHPGEPGKSLLIEAIRYGNDDLQMPPEAKLPSGEIALLAQWIAMGAPDPRASNGPKVDVAKLWALQPIRSQAVPEVKNVRWPNGDIDRYILAGLEKKDLSPQTKADPHTLLRRVTFDLTGLPPTPGEILAFTMDDSPMAYPKVVDRLLHSTAFGDHWGRHWFDLSGYADLADIQGNVLVRDAWRYRDYVIASLNADKPLKLFIHQQIAGDLLPWSSPEQRREQIIATGYLAIGPWTLQNYIKGQLDADVVDHQIDRIGRTFLAQTVSCARCHDHKFDPIPTADYYALAGIFHSTLTTSYDGPGVWSVINEVRLPFLPRSPEERDLNQQKLASLKSQRDTLQAEQMGLLLEIPGSSEANALTMEKPVAANEQGRGYALYVEAGPSVWSGTGQSTTDRDGIRIELLRENGSVLAAFVHQPGAWPGTKDAQRLKSARFTYTGDGSGGIRVRLTSSTPGSFKFGGAIDNLKISADDEFVYFEDFDSLVPGQVSGRQVDTQLPVLAKAHVPGWIGSGLNHTHAVDLGDGDYAVQFYGGGPKGLASAKPSTEPHRKAFARAKHIQLQLNRLGIQIAEGEAHDAAEHALAVRDVDEPSDGPIYRRGDFQNLGDIVPRGFLGAVPVSRRHEIPGKSSGRLQLAQWLTDPDNPLTSRVLVNRVWHHLFGQGLVPTVDYFGVHGESPSHPELLDFLALHMKEKDQWSLKKTIRRMVLSQAYQMASSHSVEAMAADPENRLLWRMPRRRLNAESIRDAMLAASGQLNCSRGGSSLGLEIKDNIRGAGGNVNPATWGNKIPDYIRNRRTVYLPLLRQRPVGDLEILSIFDFPHPNDIVGARPNTTVATQALFLLNAPFVRQQSVELAARLAKDSADETTRIDRLYLVTLNRPAGPNEIKSAQAFLDLFEKDFQNIDTPREKAWTQLCHALLGSNAFLFRE
jgi:hypothetical protein